ncbi:hypothetical protein N0V90_005940 [Kalmusia sp. IMI 367209]|nr:hypothetical protein N0V90_005940 [Kalmusia sp. IMI 367209]
MQPYQLMSALLMTAGMALFYTLEAESSKARYIGPEVLFGFGLGLGSQVPMTAVQGFSTLENVASSTAIMLSEYSAVARRTMLTEIPACQAISGAYFVPVAQSIWANRMLHELQAVAPNLDVGTVISTGASEIQHVFKGGDLVAVVDAYMVGIKDVFAFSLACSAFAVLLALAIPMKKLPDHGDSIEKDDTELA